MKDKDRLLTVDTVKSRTVVEFASGNRKGPYIMTLISSEESTHDFIVKFSPSACVAVVASLTGEMAARIFAYHAHGTADSDKSCCYPWFVCHDKILNQQCMLAKACPPMISHLTSN